MTTAAHVKQAMRPLLERHDDLAIVGRFLIIKPVHHVLRSVCIDRRSNPDIFAVHSGCDMTFMGKSVWSLGWGRDHHIPKRLWNIHDAGSIQLLRDLLEQEVLPELRKVKSIDDFLAYVKPYMRSSDYDHNHHLWTWAAIAKGNFDEAISIVDAALAHWRLTKEPKFYQALLARDRTALIAFLHESEAFTIGNFKLEKHWEPTPFPLELQAAEHIEGPVKPESIN
ncbi:MAG: hypothetical protein ACRECY_19100 [Phyllobacterium sp.]